MSAPDAFDEELAQLADQMLGVETIASGSSSTKPAEVKTKAASAKKSPAPMSYEVFGTVDAAVSQGSSRKARSVDQLVSMAMDVHKDTDVVRLEIIAVKPAGELFFIRALKPPGKSVLASLKKLGKSDLKFDKEKKDDASFIVAKKLKLSAKKIKKTAAAASAEAKAKKPKKKSEGGAEGSKKTKLVDKTARKRLNENLDKLKKKTVVRGKMAVTAAEAAVASAVGV